MKMTQEALDTALATLMAQAGQHLTVQRVDDTLFFRTTTEGVQGRLDLTFSLNGGQVYVRVNTHPKSSLRTVLNIWGGSLFLSSHEKRASQGKACPMRIKLLSIYRASCENPHKPLEWLTQLEGIRNDFRYDMALPLEVYVMILEALQDLYHLELE